MGSPIVLQHRIEHDAYTAIAEQMFDVPHADESITVIENNIQLPDEWNIGVIYGPSGSGKSTLLKSFGHIPEFLWNNNKPVISNFDSVEPEEATKLLSSVGFNTIPAWLRPFNALSNGEQFRCNLARAMVHTKDLINALDQQSYPVLIDEFTSVVDRNVAKSASYALQKFVRRENKQVILASCHADIIDWLQPDWVYNPTEALTHVFPRGSLCRPEIPLKVFRVKYEAWDLFKHYHYLSSDLNKAARCFMATWNDVPVAFIAILAMPNPYKKNCWRASRTVVLPDFQGLSIGVKLSDYVGSLVKAAGGTYYSKTIHPAMIAYRLRSGLWKQTAHSRQSRKGGTEAMESKNWFVTKRFCYAFEYTGPAAEDALLFTEDIGIRKRDRNRKSP